MERYTQTVTAHGGFNKLENMDNNKLIAEFMGATEVKKDTYKFPNRTGLPLQIGTINYHSDWNWLMEVLDKIEGLGVVVEIRENVCYISPFPNNYISELEQTKLQATYKAVVEFIKWYNNELKTELLEYTQTVTAHGGFEPIPNRTDD